MTPELNVKLIRELRRFEREPIHPCGDTQEWTLRCMHQGCKWAPKESFESADAAAIVGELHAESTGHPVLPEGWIRFRGAIIRAKSSVR